MEKEIIYCDNCGDPIENPIKTPHWENGNYNLCSDCEKGYEENGNKTGHCGLNCCITGRCDESC